MAMMMKCGHAAQAVNNNHEPVCPVCIGIPEAEQIDFKPADLSGRVAYCGMKCGSSQPSNPQLAFFQSVPDEDSDRYYCGCRGWD